MGVDIPEPEGEDSAALALTLDMLEMPAEELERRFRDVWGNNADEIRYTNNQRFFFFAIPETLSVRTGHHTQNQNYSSRYGYYQVLRTIFEDLQQCTEPYLRWFLGGC